MCKVKEAFRACVIMPSAESSYLNPRKIAAFPLRAHHSATRRMTRPPDALPRYNPRYLPFPSLPAVRVAGSYSLVPLPARHVERGLVTVVSVLSVTGLPGGFPSNFYLLSFPTKGSFNFELTSLPFFAPNCPKIVATRWRPVCGTRTGPSAEMSSSWSMSANMSLTDSPSPTIECTLCHAAHAAVLPQAARVVITCVHANFEMCRSALLLP